MTKKVAQKAVLQDEIKQRMLSANSNIVELEEAVNGNFFTLRNQLRDESPTLTQPHYMEAIKRILGLPLETCIHRVVKEDTELHHD